MIDLVTSLLGGVQGALFLVGAALVAIIGAYWKGRSAGKAKERARQDERSLQNRETRDEIDRDIAGASSGDVRGRLRDDARK